MKSHPFDHDFRINSGLLKQFQRNGFVKLNGFLNPNVVKVLLNRIEEEMKQTHDCFKTEFSRLKYDFESDKTAIYELLERPISVRR